VELAAILTTDCDNRQQAGTINTLELAISSLQENTQTQFLSPSSWCVCQFRHFRVRQADLDVGLYVR